MKRKFLLFFILFIGLTNFAFSQRTVKASYYAHKFHGRKTASGEKFDMYKLTCAHKTLPFGTILKIRNPKNNKEVYVTVTDRGPYIKGRSIDLSYAAAKELGMIPYGVLTVEYECVDSIPDEDDEIERILIPDLENLEKIVLPIEDIILSLEDITLEQDNTELLINTIKLSDYLQV